ncbi:TlpA family protein disulfide reductase [Flavobacterium sp.]|uniref:TlpA family protein disulfide reductase n=1 Tax=Flavobacterium sp. TaxID=239 RepID=UPI0039E2E3FA
MSNFLKNTWPVWLLFTLFSFAAPPETITFSGKITNNTDGKFKLWGESFEKEIKLKSDGSFNEKITINYSGTYFLTTAENRAAIYLTRGTNLSINADNKDFYKTLKFTGKGSIENQYIASKNAYVNQINQEKLYSLDEAAFLAELKAIKQDILKLLDHGKFPDGKFKTSELRNINYLEQIFIVSYAKNHAHFLKLPNFTVSDSFPRLDPKLDYDNESDFLFSNPYKQLVNLNFNDLVQRQLKPEDQFVWKVALPEIKKVKSQSIKNALLYALSFEVNAANPDAKMLYDELVGLSTNPHFKKEITATYNKIAALNTGSLSPAFDYENHKGGKTALESLKGKYVYIDVWATWCGPCIREIPSLQKLESDYKGKNIEFVSISIDAKKDYEKWKKMVTDRQMGGIQLMADNDWNSQFIVDYAIVAIPRFILIDPDGKIVSADAPRPSDPALVTLLAGLKI